MRQPLKVAASFCKRYGVAANLEEDLEFKADDTVRIYAEEGEDVPKLIRQHGKSTSK